MTIWDHVKFYGTAQNMRDTINGHTKHVSGRLGGTKCLYLPSLIFTSQDRMHIASPLSTPMCFNFCFSCSKNEKA